MAENKFDFFANKVLLLSQICDKLISSIRKEVTELLHDYSKLRGRIREKCRTIKAFAEAIGITEASVYNKLSGQLDFTQTQIQKAISILSLTTADIPAYFFADESELNSESIPEAAHAEAPES